ncbi:MAG: phytanoyl-CoA dioxygenase family protein [Pseudomonadota bacterium]
MAEPTCAEPKGAEPTAAKKAGAAGALSAEQHAAAMADYLEDGRARALALGNRGPLRFTDSRRLHPEILEAYWAQGFYVFEDVLEARELAELRAGIEQLFERAPASPGAMVDAAGRPPLGHDITRDTYLWVRPLADPVGGTSANGGRHPSKMSEPVPAADAPDKVIYMMFNMCETTDAGLRLYGHPGLLAVAEAINGPDFTPYNDAIFVKQPGLGASVAWHQDGLTHWDAPDWDEGIHGFNFQVQLYDCTPANCLWVVPGTHKLGRVDIKALVAANGGSDRLPDAVPLFCDAGGVTIVNRQALHGSFANTSEQLRVSLTFGFHRRAAVLGQRGAIVVSSDHVYDEARIFERSSVIATAIDARARHFLDEVPYQYAPFAGLMDQYRWDESARERLHNYSQLDIGI